LRLERDESGIISRGEIESKMEQLLGNEKLKARALDLKNIVKTSIKEGGGSHNNLKNFVEWMKSLKSSSCDFQTKNSLCIAFFIFLFLRFCLKLYILKERGKQESKHQ
jgi:hypothetical protein